MKYLQLQILKVRVWMLRRRLRSMGFREVADRTVPQTLLRLKIERVERPNQVMRWLEIGLLITGLALWFKCYLCMVEHVKAVTPQLKQNSRPTPDAVPSRSRQEVSARSVA
jgi:hypothetical protein